MAIQNPFKEGVLAHFKMKDMAISTSGNYRRYVESKANNHLINPKQKSSQKRFASITLISNTYSNSDLDAYATAASVMPYKEALKFLKKMDLGYLVVTNNQKVLINKKFKDLSTKLWLDVSVVPHEREYIKAAPLTFQNSKKRLF